MMLREEALEQMQKQDVLKQYPTEVLQQLARRATYKTRRKGKGIAYRSEILSSGDKGGPDTRLPLPGGLRDARSLRHRRDPGQVFPSCGMINLAKNLL